tara:strand:+ start:295 stop:798 length:504 start_codon:yes stop_codon:yes gene_type:complete
MTTNVISPVTKLLDRLNISYDVITIHLSEDRKPIRNLVVLLRLQERDPTFIIRSLLFRTRSNTFVLLVVPEGSRADWGVLRNHLGERKLKMVDLDQIKELTGYDVGAVTPIVLLENIQVLLDETVSNYLHVVIGSGILGYELSLSNQDLSTAMGSAVHKGLFTKTDL